MLFLRSKQRIIVSYDDKQKHINDSTVISDPFPLTRKQLNAPRENADLREANREEERAEQLQHFCAVTSTSSNVSVSSVPKTTG